MLAADSDFEKTYEEKRLKEMRNVQIVLVSILFVFGV